MPRLDPEMPSGGSAVASLEGGTAFLVEGPPSLVGGTPFFLLTVASLLRGMPSLVGGTPSGQTNGAAQGAAGAGGRGAAVPLNCARSFA